MDTRTRSESSPLERLFLGARLELEFFAERENFLQLHLRDGLSWGTASTLPGVGHGAQLTAWRAGIQMTEGTAREAIEAGEIRPMRPALVAALVISALQVWLTDWVVQERDRPIAVVADELVEHLRRSLAAG